MRRPLLQALVSLALVPVSVCLVKSQSTTTPLHTTPLSPSRPVHKAPGFLASPQGLVRGDLSRDLHSGGDCGFWPGSGAQCLALSNTSYRFGGCDMYCDYFLRRHLDANKIYSEAHWKHPDRDK